MDTLYVTSRPDLLITKVINKRANNTQNLLTLAFLN